MDPRFISMKISLVRTAQQRFPDYAHFFEQANYGPAFRTAALNLEFDLLVLLLREDVRTAICLDINGRSRSTGNTALDYAFASSVKNGQSGSVVDLLIKAGVKTQNELLGIEESDSQSDEADTDYNPDRCSIS